MMPNPIPPSIHASSFPPSPPFSTLPAIQTQEIREIEIERHLCKTSKFKQ